MDSSASKNSSDPSDEEESDPHLWESILRAPILNIEISRQYERVLSTHIFYLDFMYSIHHVSISENHLYLSIYLFICGALSIGPIVRLNHSLSLTHTNTVLYTHTDTILISIDTEIFGICGISFYTTKLDPGEGIFGCRCCWLRAPICFVGGGD